MNWRYSETWESWIKCNKICIMLYKNLLYQKKCRRALPINFTVALKITKIKLDNFLKKSKSPIKNHRKSAVNPEINQMKILSPPNRNNNQWTAVNQQTAWNDVKNYLFLRNIINIYFSNSSGKVFIDDWFWCSKK